MIRKNLYIEVSAGGLCAYTDMAGTGRGFTWTPFAQGIFDDEQGALPAEIAAFGVPLLKRRLFPPAIIMVANTARTVIRMTKLPEPAKKLTPTAKWNLVRGAFPLGRTLNENTHIFDGCFFDGGNGERLFLMAALPQGTAAEITRLGEKLAGIRRLVRLETVEHLLFRRFVSGDAGVHWVIFPQEGGLRVLTIANGLPANTHHLPCVPEIKEGALLRTVQADAPEKATFLTRPDWNVAWEENRGWTEAILAEREIIVNEADFIPAASPAPQAAVYTGR